MDEGRRGLPVEELKPLAVELLEVSGKENGPVGSRTGRDSVLITGSPVPNPNVAASTTFPLWAKEFLFHDTTPALDAASA